MAVFAKEKLLGAPVAIGEQCCGEPAYGAPALHGSRAIAHAFRDECARGCDEVLRRTA